MSLRWPALVMIACIALTGVAGAWLGYPLNQLWRWLAALWLLALLFEYLAVQLISVRVALQQLVVPYLGRAGQWRYELQSLHRTALNLRFRPLAPLSFQGELADTEQLLPSRNTAALEFSQMPTQLGAQAWPDQPVEVRGPLGFANWIKLAPAESADGEPFVSLVEPDVLESAQDRAAMERFGSRPVFRRAMGGSEFRALRAYAPGDPPSSIYWKASAKTAKLMVRETEAEQQLMLFFLIDCGARGALQVGELNGLSHAINLAARMSELADRAGDRYGLLAFADEPLVQLPCGRGPAHQRRVRHALANLRCSAAESNPLDAVIATKRLIPQRALVLLVTNLDDANVSGQLLQATSMLRPQHLPMIVSVEDQAIRHTAQACTESREGLYNTLSAQEYQRTAQRTKAQLQRMGATVVEAPPEQLEKAVFERYRTLRTQNRV